MESSYSAFLSDPFLSCVGSMMKIDETWCQPLSSEGGTLLRSPIIHSASAKKSVHSSSISKEQTEFAYNMGTLSQGTLLPNFSLLTWLRKESQKEFLLICKNQHKRRTVLENDYDNALGLDTTMVFR